MVSFAGYSDYSIKDFEDQFNFDNSTTCYHGNDVAECGRVCICLHYCREHYDIDDEYAACLVCECEGFMERPE